LFLIQYSIVLSIKLSHATVPLMPIKASKNVLRQVSSVAEEGRGRERKGKGKDKEDRK
jgi:hypothetical protein